MQRDCAPQVRPSGWPIAVHKFEGPATRLAFLGIEIDTLSGQLQLPGDKRCYLRSLPHEWEDRKRKQPESLIYLLNHACKVVRSNTLRMTDLLHTIHHPPNSQSA